MPISRKLKGRFHQRAAISRLALGTLLRSEFLSVQASQFRLRIERIHRTHPAIHEKLKEQGIMTDYRGDRLRFGFGTYHDPEDMPVLAGAVKKALS